MMSTTFVQKLWAQVPDVGCQGLCADSCGPVVASDDERQILESLGIALDFDRETLACNQLVEGKCSIYEHRPLPCRLWGAVPKMPCPFGCETTLTDAGGSALMRGMYGF